MKRQLKIILLCLTLFTVHARAQNPDLEYFSKVPTRYKKPGLSPLQGVHFSRVGMPGNTWVANAMEFRTDLVRVKFTPRVSLMFSGSALLGYRQQSRDLYTVMQEKAFEKVNYYFGAPALSSAVSYGFFFPYFISARVGMYYGWESAQYSITIPRVYSESDEAATTEMTSDYSQMQKTGYMPYLSFELHRPWKSHFPNKRPMGWTVAYTYYPNNPEGSRTAWNYGIYWHIQSK